MQLWHGPSQALSQQTPLAQTPDRHSWLLAHGSPIVFFAAHCSSPVQ
jgi:hypothetical protein